MARRKGKAGEGAFVEVQVRAVVRVPQHGVPPSRPHVHLFPERACLTVRQDIAATADRFVVI
ncbi:hypothetical protein D3C71_1758880 [compost metagenome]